MTFASWLTIGLFTFTYLGMAAGGLRGLRVDRSWIACSAAVVLLVSGALSMPEAAQHLDPGALLLLLALMLISAQFDFSGVYAWLNRYLTEHAERPAVLLAGVVLLGGFLSAILVNDIVAFALTPLLCRSLHQRGLEPRPFLLALAAMAIVYAVIWLQWHRCWGEPRPLTAVDTPVEHIYGARSYLKPLLASLALLALFATTLPRELSALLIAVMVMVSRRVDSRDYVNKVDWNLLLLFVGLFLVSGAALQLPQLAQGAAWLAEHGVLPQGVWSLAASSLVAGNLIGNVPFVVLLLGLMPDLPHSVLIGLAVMSTLAGNLLLIGSVVNLIVAEAAKRQGVSLGFVDYARSGVPVTLLSMAVAGLWLGLGGWVPW